jgi:hypothetical protein
MPSNTSAAVAAVSMEGNLIEANGQTNVNYSGVTYHASSRSIPDSRLFCLSPGITFRHARGAGLVFNDCYSFSVSNCSVANVGIQGINITRAY